MTYATTPGRPRGETRQRILDTALRLFAEQGYAGTSIRDLADELGLTKAAVHYHFAAKEQIVRALVEPMSMMFAELVDGAATRGAPPRELLLGVRDLLVASGPLLSVLAADPSAVHACDALDPPPQAIAVRAGEALAGPAADPARRLRAHCALGAFLAGWDVAFRGLDGTPVGSVSHAQLEVLLGAALAALGEPTPGARA